MESERGVANRRRGEIVAARFALAAIVSMLPASAALAQTFNPLGDGSAFSNADLVRDATTGCQNCAPEPPHDFSEPFFDVDWSLALRGSYVSATSGSYFEASAVPRVTLRHDTLRGGYEISASAEVTRSSFEDARLAALRAGFAGDYKLDAVTAISGNLNLALTQASAQGPGVSPTIAAQPLVVSGDGEIEASRDFGPFVVSGRVNGSRTIYGPTTLADASLTDNSSQSNWTAEGGLRLGYRVTPILTAFVDGSVGYQAYDAASPTYLVKLDAVDYEARTGLSAEWNQAIKAEASIGVGLRRFVEPALGEVASLLYDASVTLRPDETVEMKAALSTDFGAPGPSSGGTARLEYAATGDISYRVNPWLRLRASAGWRQAHFVGTATVEHGYNAGAGADYVLNEFTTLTADYGYSYVETTPNPGEDSHRVTVGVTFSR
jgi:hypothetical protein